MKAKQFIVIGLGRFGQSVAKTLFQMGYDVLAVDDEEIIEAAHYMGRHGIYAEITSAAALAASAAALASASAAAVAASSAALAAAMS